MGKNRDIDPFATTRTEDVPIQPHPDTTKDADIKKIWDELPKPVPKPETPHSAVTQGQASQADREQLMYYHYFGADTGRCGR